MAATTSLSVVSLVTKLPAFSPRRRTSVRSGTDRAKTMLRLITTTATPRSLVFDEFDHLLGLDDPERGGGLVHTWPGKVVRSSDFL
jgi:hypothetical protein